MKDFEDRQIILDKINKGVYKKNASGTGAVVVVTVMFSFLFIIAVVTALFSSARGNKLNAAILIPFIIFGFVFFILIASGFLKSFKSRTNRKDLGLIANGLEIEAHIENIFGSNGSYTLECTNEKYPGVVFKSKVMADEPIIGEERTARVFIDPQNPNNYFVDIFSISPCQAGKVLMDRSELKIDDHPDIPYLSTNIMFIVVAVFMIPFVLTGLGLVVSSFARDNFFMLPFGVLWLAACAFMIYKASQSKGNTRNALAKGHYLEATGTRYWVTHSDDSTTHHFECRYVVPGTRDTYKFHTTSVDSRAEVLVGSKVRVYVDPDNMNVYYVAARKTLSNFGFTAKDDTHETE